MDVCSSVRKNNEKNRDSYDYEDWCKVHRRTLKKMMKDTVTTWMQWAAVVLITVGLPIGMVTHWLLIGY